MLANSTGYVANIQWFTSWDLAWTINAHPAVAPQAARASPFPPDEVTLRQWCALYYPAWVPFFWPVQRAMQQPSFLDQMD